ncbi:MAG: CYTH domain-containing protein [Ignavibacteriales bacterium]|nr:CYTH domain-containing protein [Ignavibacteriales bacterium]
MAVNLELKIKTGSHQKYINTLENINASFEGILKQKDVYYKIPKGLLKLRIENNESYCLIKYLRDEKGKRWSNYELLFLNGKNPEKYLSEIFKIVTVVEKKRTLYLYKGTRIHLDEVKSLGKFLELETIVAGSKADAQMRFDEIIRLLNLDTAKQIRKSYKNLIEAKK